MCEKNGNLIFPKYDEYGALIKYTLDEKAINGYTFKIGNQEIVNNYDGGDPVKIIVTKHWENIDTASEYPTIKFTLHQKFTVKDEEKSNSPSTDIEWTYTKLLTKEDMDSDGNWRCIFGGTTGENFRKYAPNGTEFEYRVTAPCKKASEIQNRLSCRQWFIIIRKPKGLITTGPRILAARTKQMKNCHQVRQITQ